MSFNSDLAFGKQYENIAVQIVENDGEIIIEHPEGYCKEYDFKTDKYVYEVKSDRLTYKTGNLYVEYECSGKPSGIATTTADYWFYFVVMPVSIKNYPNNYRAYKIPTSHIRQLITPTARTIMGGDCRTKGYLFKESSLTDFLLAPKSSSNPAPILAVKCS